MAAATRVIAMAMALGICGCATQQVARVGTPVPRPSSTEPAKVDAFSAALAAKLNLELHPYPSEAWPDLCRFYAERHFAPVFTRIDDYDVRASALVEAIA